MSSEPKRRQGKSIAGRTIGLSRVEKEKKPTGYKEGKIPK